MAGCLAFVFRSRQQLWTRADPELVTLVEAKKGRNAIASLRKPAEVLATCLMMNFIFR